MKCHFCQSVPRFKEESTNLAFCDKFCQVGHHLINGQNPLELDDTLFLILLEVPPNKLFKMIEVSDKFKNIIKDDDRFKRNYLGKWYVNDKFYFKVLFFYPEWRPFITDYNGYLSDKGNDPYTVLGEALRDGMFDIAKMILDHPTGKELPLIRLVYEFIRNIDALSLLFKYIVPDEEILVYAIIKRADIEIVELILESNDSLDVTTAKQQVRGELGKANIYAILTNYQEKKRLGIFRD